ncbi:GNAT family N-acetyltransferase [Flagellimonas nanhaiensis]|uniref:GNAT family N-acetyltransferase n=1 Tax=Flagellimonas nanhaiensis TaxID=2292706 RepID=A0A371JQV2_9FLAO|nr:GNAT family N-acetyltransferase [Allomuricauda nanhaiensis]RDY59890.1 GNAT family N-acetyltransferase [Allomuricauda nanhaiensis]
MTSVSFKRCKDSDLEALVKIAKETFVAAFEKDNDPNDFRDYIEKAFSKTALEAELNNPGSLFYFVFDKEELVGYFKLNLGAAQTEINDDSSVELERIYVVPGNQGKSIGHQMLQKVLALAKELNKACVWLGVWEHNPGAIRFYQRQGFKKFGEHPYFIGEDEQTDWLLRLELQ